MVRLEELVGSALAEGDAGDRGSGKLMRSLGNQGERFLPRVMRVSHSSRDHKLVELKRKEENHLSALLRILLDLGERMEMGSRIVA